VIPDTVLPHAPYKNPAGADITAMHGGLWCTFAYRVAEGVHTGNATRFTFSKGGQQCNRPEGSHGAVR
jgi:hypothetical protein